MDNPNNALSPRARVLILPFQQFLDFSHANDTTINDAYSLQLFRGFPLLRTQLRTECSYVRIRGQCASVGAPIQGDRQRTVGGWWHAAALVLGAGTPNKKTNKVKLVAWAGRRRGHSQSSTVGTIDLLLEEPFLLGPKRPRVKLESLLSLLCPHVRVRDGGIELRKSVARTSQCSCHRRKAWPTWRPRPCASRQKASCGLRDAS